MIGFVLLSCLSDFKDETVEGEFVKVPFTPHKEDIGYPRLAIDSTWMMYSPSGENMKLMHVKTAFRDTFINVGDQEQYNFVHDCPQEYVFDPEAWALSQCPFPKFYIDGNWDTINRSLKNGSCAPFYWEKDSLVDQSSEYQDTARSYIGQHTVMTYLGRGGKDLEKDSVAKE